MPTVYHMQDIQIKVIIYKCLNKNFLVICTPRLQPLSYATMLVPTGLFVFGI